MPSPSFLRRLKERKLVQWALAYLAGAFVVFQLLDALEGALGLTPTIQRAILVIVGIGFFVALILAWYHGEKGRQRVSGPELLMVAALLVVAGVALSSLGRRAGPPASPGGLLPVPVDDDRPSVAVLLCDNFSPNPQDAFRAQGIHEEILLRLQRMPSIRSIGRTSVRQFAENPPPVDEIAEVLGVGFVGECSVLKDPEETRIRVTFQLLDSDGTQLWADSYDRDLTVSNLYDIQSEIAQRVAGSVGAVLIPVEKEHIGAAPTEDLLAYDLYTRARLLWWTRGREALEQAVGLFQEAIAEDPDFALAYAGLAETYAVLPELGGRPFEEILPLAREAVEKALALEPDLAEAYTASAYLYAMFEWDWRAAERDYLRAIELDPDHGTAHQWYGEMLGQAARWEEAIVETQKALELDPRSPAFNSMMGFLLTFTGRPEEAIHWFERAHAIAPDFAAPCWGLGDTYTVMGAYAQAVPWYECASENAGVDPEPSRAYLAALSDPTKLPEAVGILTSSTDHLNAAQYLVQLGHVEAAFAALERAFQEHSPYLPWLNSMPVYDRIRSDPRFQTLLRRMNFPN